VQNRSFTSWRPIAARNVFFFLVLLSVESIVFYIQVAANVAPFYPPHHDQTKYLIDAYDLAGAMRDFGFGAGLRRSLTSQGPNGALFPLQGAMLSLFLGIDRAGVLTINLVLFSLLQIVVFWLVRWKTRRDSDAWLAVALILLLHSPFFVAGGMFDFRIDFFALCTFGIWVCVVLRSGVFRNLRWSIVAGLIGAWLICTRYISVVYLAPILAALFAVYAVAWLKAATRFRRAAAWLRARNIVVSGLIGATAISPFLWINRDLIYNYYFVSMFISDEKEIRAQQYGIQTLWEHLWMYPRSILVDHLGIPLLAACVLLLIWASLDAGALQARGRAVFLQNIRRQKHAFLFLGAAILIPLAFLNLSTHKSPVIGGILCVPIVLVVVMLISEFRNGERTSFAGNWTGRIGGPYVATAFVTAAMLVFMYRAGATRLGLRYTDNLAINEVHDKIIRYVLDTGNASPSITADGIVDYLSAGSFTVASYERFGRLIRFRQMFPTDVVASSREEALARSARSDIVILTDPVRGREQPFPLNSAIRNFWRELQAMAMANFTPLTSTTVRGIPLQVFVKPAVKIIGLSGDWVTSSGLTIEVEPRDLLRWPLIVLEGVAFYDVLGGQPEARAIVLDSAGQPGKELPVSFERTASSSGYVVTITAAETASESQTPVKIQLSFDRFFVPRALGINADPRELVIMAPSRRELRARPQT
jgi:hypothetical protein